MQRLVDEGLQSDQRFAESLVRGRIQRGYGPYVIRQDAKQKQLSMTLVEASTAWQEVDWFGLAAEVVDRKYRDRETEAATWERAMRFMQRRGFPHDVVREVMGSRPRQDSCF